MYFHISRPEMDDMKVGTIFEIKKKKKTGKKHDRGQIKNDR
jgi:hypothetical protein